MTETTPTKRKRRMAREPKPETTAAGDGASQETQASQEQPEPTIPNLPTKTDIVLALLKRTGGATLNEIVEATGWLPHTTRAALTGLKKNGHIIERMKVDGVSRYAITESAVQ